MSATYLDNPLFQQAMANAPSFKKSAKTGLRRPSAAELNTNLDTLVKDGNSLRIEVSNIIGPDHIIAQNPTPIGIQDGKEVFNQWLISKEQAIKNYGQEVINELTDQVSFHQKSATIKAVELTPGLLQALGGSGDTLEFSVSWSPEPMKAKVGDFLTDQGYSVSAHDMATTYEQIPPSLPSLSPIHISRYRAEPVPQVSLPNKPSI